MRARRTKTVRAQVPAYVMRKPAKQLFRVAGATIGFGLIILAVLLVHTYRSYAQLVDNRLARGYLSSRAGIYAAPRTLRAGQKYLPVELGEVLRRAGYIESDSASEVWNGSFSAAGDGVVIRPFMFHLRITAFRN